MSANGVPLAIAALFVLTSGAYLEWLVAVRSKGAPPPSPAQQAALAAAAAELQAQSDALEAVRRGVCGAGASPLAAPSAVCGACGVAGCSPRCSEALRFLVAPPNAHCTPRGPSFFFGCSLGFNPLLGPKPGGSGGGNGVDEAGDGGAAAARREYWRQLGGMMTWQFGMWVFGLFVVVMMVAARAREPVLSAADYAQVGWFLGGQEEGEGVGLGFSRG